MDEFPALDLWDVVIKCYNHRTVPKHQPIHEQETARGITRPNPNKRETEMLINCRMWTTSPQTQILLEVSHNCTSFQDTEAVIKMITKGRSSTTIHVSRTHRVALDWLFDRIILDPKIQIIDTKNQLADMTQRKLHT